MTFIEPYNDEKLEYDYDRHEYRLTLNYAKSELVDPYKDDGKYEKHIKSVSRTIYNHIYNYSHTSNKRYTEVILNCTEEGRSLIAQALLSQLDADNDNGYDDIKRQNPINYANGTIMERNLIRENAICVEAEDILLNSSAELEGYNIMSMIAIFLPNSFLKNFEGFKY